MATDEHTRTEGFAEDPLQDPLGDPAQGPRGAEESEAGVAASGSSWPRDYDLAWTIGWEDQGQTPPHRRPARRRWRFSPQAFAVLISLAALAVSLTAVIGSTDEPLETVRYVPVRAPEVVGPAPTPGAIPATVPPSDLEPATPVAPPVTLEQPVEPESTGEAAPPAPAPEPPPPTVKAQEPVVYAASQVEPSVVLLQTTQGQGSGIIYDEAGLVLTAAHVVDEAEPLTELFGGGDSGEAGAAADPNTEPPGGLESFEIPEVLNGEVPDVIVLLPSGVRTSGKVVAANSELDVAVVQIDPALDFAVAKIGPLSTVQVGQTAVAVGSPFGMENVVTVGVVSALNQVLYDEALPPLGMIQTDAPINQGNSGGALADLEGRVIGMNVAIQSTFGGGNIGVGFATPIEVAIRIAEELLAGREVRFGFLGITGYTPRLGEPGAIVASVAEGGPAEAAGMQVNDRIVSFDGQPVISMGELTVAVRLRAPGTEVPVEVVRGDQLIRLFIPLGDRVASLEEELDTSDEDLGPDVEP